MRKYHQQLYSDGTCCTTSLSMESLQTNYVEMLTTYCKDCRGRVCHTVL